MHAKRIAQRAVSLALIMGISALLVGLHTSKDRPVSRLVGRCIAKETGLGLPDAGVLLTPRFTVEEGTVRGRSLKTDENGEFSTGQLPIGEYSIQASSAAHTCNPVRVTVEEGSERRVTIEMTPEPDRIGIEIHDTTFTPDETPSAVVTGFFQRDSFTLTTYRISWDDSLDAALHPEGNDLRYDAFDEIRNRIVNTANTAIDGQRVRRISSEEVPIRERDIEGAFRQYANLPARGQGAYIYTVSGGRAASAGYAVVTELGIVTKRYLDDLLVYATHVSDGKPWAGVEIEARVEGETVATGRADAQGIAHLKLPRTDGSLVVFGRSGASVAILRTHYWSDAQPEGGQLRMYAYTDRPIYRPGHTVHFKGILRKQAGVAYTIPASETVHVNVRDWRDTEVYSGDLMTTGFGSFADSLTLSEEALTGDYVLTASVGEQELRTTFAVAEYRKPEFSVTVTPEREFVVRGDKAVVDFSAEYYFGGPVAGADARCIIRRHPQWLRTGSETAWDALYEYEEDYGYGGGEIVDTRDVRLDDRGAGRIEVDTRHDDEADDGLENDYRYTIEVSVTDASHFSASGSGSMLVTRGEFMLTVEPDQYVLRTGEAAAVTITAKDHRGRVKPGIELTVSSNRETWTSDSLEFAAESTAQLETDENGEARWTTTPATEGHYAIRAEARDHRRNRIVGSGYTWVTSADATELAYTYPEIELVPDKSVYQPGDTARILVNAEQPTDSALLTIEGAGPLRAQTIRLGGKSSVIEVAITRDHVPNVFVGVSYVAGKKFVEQTKLLKVSPASRALTIEVTADREEYQPGDTAAFSVLATDSDGQPAHAELSFGVVDESLYALNEDPAGDMVSFFFERRYNPVETDYSFPRIYLDPGDKTGTTIVVRKDFRDTAFWASTVVTDDDGRAEFTVPVPDSLTTWRATARAHTLRTEVGAGVAKVLCNKPIMARLAMPRFLRQGDETVLTGLVHNETDTSRKFVADLDVGGLALRSDGRQSGTVGPGDMRKFEWEVLASSVMAPLITLTADSDGEGDAMQLPLPILPHGTPRSLGRAGVVSGREEVRLDSAPDRIEATQSITVRITPSVVSSLFGSLEYLAAYPYGCTEQTMSAFLPDVVVSRALAQLGIENAALESKLPDMVAKGLARLYGFQHDDGGWGWWRYDDSDTWMTAYVIDGLLTAEEAGYSVNRYVTDSGLSFLRSRAGSNADPYVIYVLARGAGLGGDEIAWLEARATPSAQDVGDLAYLCLALIETGRTDEAESYARALVAKASRSGGLASWEGAGRECLSDTEATALALLAIGRALPDHEALDEGTQWLMRRRQGDHWISTRDTARIVYALTDHVLRTQELTPDLDYTVLLNGAEMESGHLAAADALLPERVIELGPNLVGVGDNRIAIECSGTGRIYYSAILNEFIALGEGAVVLADSGIVVQRAYYRMRARYDENTDRATLQPDTDPTTKFRSGDSILVRLTLMTDDAFEHMLIEDPLPAGCEPGLRTEVDPWAWGNWWSDSVVRDDRVSFFATTLPQGERTIEYNVRAAVPGVYHTMPTYVTNMYDPSQHGYGGEQVIEIRE